MQDSEIISKADTDSDESELDSEMEVTTSYSDGNGGQSISRTESAVSAVEDVAESHRNASGLDSIAIDLPRAHARGVPVPLGLVDAPEPIPSDEPDQSIENSLPAKRAHADVEPRTNISDTGAPSERCEPSELGARSYAAKQVRLIVPPPASVAVKSAQIQTTYCICGKGEYRKMVECDNAALCEKQWVSVKYTHHTLCTLYSHT